MHGGIIGIESQKLNRFMGANKLIERRTNRFSHRQIGKVCNQRSIDFCVAVADTISLSLRFNELRIANLRKHDAISHVENRTEIALFSNIRREESLRLSTIPSLRQIARWTRSRINARYIFTIRASGLKSPFSFRSIYKSNQSIILKRILIFALKIKL